MRSLLVAVVVLTSGCSLFRPAVKDIEPLPPERHEEKTTAYFYPADEGGPQPDRLYVCGIHAGSFNCIRWDDYMKYLDATAPEGVNL